MNIQTVAQNKNTETLHITETKTTKFHI